jgi:hypothetical protein
VLPNIGLHQPPVPFKDASVNDAHVLPDVDTSSAYAPNPVLDLSAIELSDFPEALERPLGDLDHQEHVVLKSKQHNYSQLKKIARQRVMPVLDEADLEESFVRGKRFGSWRCCLVI